MLPTALILVSHVDFIVEIMLEFVHVIGVREATRNTRHDHILGTELFLRHFHDKVSFYCCTLKTFHDFSDVLQKIFFVLLYSFKISDLFSSNIFSSFIFSNFLRFFNFHLFMSQFLCCHNPPVAQFFVTTFHITFSNLFFLLRLLIYQLTNLFSSLCRAQTLNSNFYP